MVKHEHLCLVVTGSYQKDHKKYQEIGGMMDKESFQYGYRKGKEDERKRSERLCPKYDTTSRRIYVCPKHGYIKEVKRNE